MLDEWKLGRESMYCIAVLDIVASFLVKESNRSRSHFLGKLAWRLKSNLNPRKCDLVEWKRSAL